MNGHRPRAAGFSFKASTETRFADPPFPVTGYLVSTYLEFDHQALSPLPAAQFGTQGITAEYRELPPGEPFRFAWSGDAHYLALYDGAIEDGAAFATGRVPLSIRAAPAVLTFVPPLARLWGWCRPAASAHSLTALYVEPREFERATGFRLPWDGLRTQLNFADRELTSSMNKLRAALSEPAPRDDAYIEALCTCLALEIGCYERQQLAQAGSPRGLLDAACLQRVTEFVAAHLSEDLTLGDLAAVAGLSRFHFVRAFKRSTGESPCQYLNLQRIRRAKQLLGCAEPPSLEDIAALVGFKSVSQFARAFRRRVGTTPRAYRANPVDRVRG
jgi:AraC family transcriptional regulator